MAQRNDEGGTGRPANARRAAARQRDEPLRVGRRVALRARTRALAQTLQTGRVVALDRYPQLPVEPPIPVRSGIAAPITIRTPKSPTRYLLTSTG